MNLNKINESRMINIDTRDIDERGQILSLCDNQTNNVSYIKSFRNTIRSNHYHVTDWHIIYVLRGKMNYFYKKIKSNFVKHLLIKSGQSVFTPVLEIHATHFESNTELIVMSKNKRDQKNYEKDTKRVKFITKDNINTYLDKFKNERI